MKGFSRLNRIISESKIIHVLEDIYMRKMIVCCGLVVTAVVLLGSGIYCAAAFSQQNPGICGRCVQNECIYNAGNGCTPGYGRQVIKGLHYIDQNDDGICDNFESQNNCQQNRIYARSSCRRPGCR